MKSIAVEVTARCNQKCSYCYNPWRGDGGAAVGELESPRLLSLLDRVLSTEALQSVTLTGGDPFMRRDIHRIIDFINARGVPVTLITNGGLVSAGTAERLAAQRVNAVQITLAGADEDMHDDVCGRGSHARAIEAIRNLVAAGVTATGSYLCTRSNWAQADAVFERFAGLGVREIAFNRFSPAGYSTAVIEKLMPTLSQVVAALEAAERAARQFSLRIVCTMPIPPCVVDYDVYPSIEFGQCSAGDPEGEAAIGPDGRVRLCTLQSDVAGDLATATLGEIVQRAGAKFRAQIPDYCRGCPASDICLGGCGAASQWVLGSARELDPFVAQHATPQFWERVRSRFEESKVNVGKLRVGS